MRAENDLLERQSFTDRIIMLDIARILGMILVYYGHVVEQVMYLGNPAAGTHYKFIYSFHMIFFFLLSGYVQNPKKLQREPKIFFAYHAVSRLAPYFLFSILMFVSALFFTGWFPLGKLISVQSYVDGIVSTLRGFPAFNIPTWFLALLMATEVLHYLVGRFLDSTVKILTVAVFLYLGGYYLNLKIDFIMPKDSPSLNFWFINEVIVVYAFFLLGVILRRHRFLLGKIKAWITFPLALLCLLIVILTFDLNQGPWRVIPAVIILLAGHGHVFWFPLTAIVGSVMLLLLAKALGDSRRLAWFGKNILVFFCLNGIFYHYVNPPFARWLMANMPHDGWIVAGASAALTVVSLALCVPVVFLFTRWLPQLVGKPSVQGPILPQLIKT